MLKHDRSTDGERDRFRRHGRRRLVPHARPHRALEASPAGTRGLPGGPRERMSEQARDEDGGREPHPTPGPFRFGIVIAIWQIHGGGAFLEMEEVRLVGRVPVHLWLSPVPCWSLDRRSLGKLSGRGLANRVTWEVYVETGAKIRHPYGRSRAEERPSDELERAIVLVSFIVGRIRGFGVRMPVGPCHNDNGVMT